MLEKIKTLVQKSKEDKQIYKEYVKIFYNLSKSKELFQNDENYQKINVKEKENFDE